MIENDSQTTLTHKAVIILSILILGLATAMAWLIFGPALVISTGSIPQVATLLNLGSKTAWYLSRSAGTVAYLLTVGSTIWGLLLSTKIIKENFPPVFSLAMHNILSWLAIALAGLHALSLLFDSYYQYTLADILLPFSGPYRAGWVGLGVIGFYLMFITSFSFLLRKQIGQRTWRKLHYLTFGVFILVTIHGLLAGTDSANPGMQWVYWGSILAVLFLTNYRILFHRSAA